MFARNRLRLISTQFVEEKLKACAILKPSKVSVTDISGGCGSFFKVEVESAAFQNKTLIDQHRMINATLKEEIKELHGLTIVTKTPPLPK